MKPRFNSAVLTAAWDDCTCAFAARMAAFAVPTAAAACLICDLTAAKDLVKQFVKDAKKVEKNLAKKRA